MYRPSEEGHPVDLAVIDRIPERPGIIRLQQQILAKLKNESDRKLLRTLEDMRLALGTERDEVYFNIGYEHGLAAARARARRGATPLLEEAKRLGRETRERVVQSKLPRWQVVLCLLECLWSVAAIESEGAEA